MTTDEQARIVNALNGLAEILDVPLTPGRIAGYLLALDDLEADDLVAALGQSARNDKFFPKPCELRDGAKAVSWRRELRVKEAIDQAEASARAGRLLTSGDMAVVAERDAIESARVAEFRRDYPGVLDAPPHERFGRWLAHVRRRFCIRTISEGRT